MAILIKQLQDTSKVFDIVSGRTHRVFPKFERNSMHSLTLPKLSQWMEEQLRKKICVALVYMSLITIPLSTRAFIMLSSSP